MAQTHLNCRAMSLARVEIHVERRRRTTEQRFQGSQARARVNALGVHESGLLGPDSFEEALEVDFLSDPPQERHGQMGMQVDQAWHHEQVASFGGRARVGDASADLGDAAPFDDKVDAFGGETRLVAHQCESRLADEERVRRHGQNASVGV